MKKLQGLIEALKFYSAFFVYTIFFRKKKNSIWLIGENLGTSCCDNGYYFFKYLKEKEEKNVFFIYDPKYCELGDLQVYADSLVRINSFKHFLLYFQSEYLIVSHGLRDAKPKYIYNRKKDGGKPLIFMQHGIIKFKKIHFTKMSYDKSIIRFIASTTEEKEIICNELMSKKDQHNLHFLTYKLHAYQLAIKSVVKEEDKELKNAVNYTKEYDFIEPLLDKIQETKNRIGFTEKQVIVTGLARYDSLLKDNEDNENERLILIFPTWRDNLHNLSNEEFVETDYYKSYAALLENRDLQILLKKTGYRVELFLHREMKKYNSIFENLEAENVSICSTNEIRSLIVKSSVLITDYSSIAWEFSVLGKEVIFYHFDKADFEQQRSSYCKNSHDWFGDVCINSKTLIDSISKSIKNNTYRDKLNVPNNCNDKIFHEIKSIPKKVYFLVYNIYGIGGTVKTVINTANYLYNEGYDIEIISVRRTSQDPKLPLETGIKISSLWDVRSNGSLYKKKSKSIITKGYNILARLTSHFKSKLIHKDEDLYSGFTLFTDLMILKKLIFLNNCNLITTIPSFNIIGAKFTNDTVKVIGQEHKFFRAHSDILQNKIIKGYSKLDTLTVLTDDDNIDYSALIDKRKIVIQPNGTTIGCNYELSQVKQKKVVSLARFVPQKRIDLLIESFAYVVDKDPECTLDIYGHGPLKNELINQVKRLKLENHIYIHEPVTDIGSVLKNASIFALSSDFEPFGMVIIEANAYGLPVVSFDIPYGPRSIIVDGVTGLKAKAFNTKDYANKILLLANDIELRNTISKNAFSSVSEKYSSKAVGESFIKLLD